MKSKIAKRVLGAFTVSGTAALIHAPIACATSDVESELGSEIQTGDVGAVEVWTVSDLRKSSDIIPYPVAGVLWEATATGRAVQGGATPFVPNFDAQSATGRSYRTLFEVATAQGINPAPLSPGQSSSGKLYFDVIGDSPTEVFYRAIGGRVLRWHQPQGVDAGGDPSPQSVPRSIPQSPAAASVPSDTMESALGGDLSTRDAPAPLVPNGWQGTPLPIEGAPITPVPAAAVPPVGMEVPPPPAPLSPSTTPSPLGPSAASNTEGPVAPEIRLGTPLPEGTTVPPATDAATSPPMAQVGDANSGAGAADPALLPPDWQGTPLPSGPMPPPSTVIAPQPVG